MSEKTELIADNGEDGQQRTTLIIVGVVVLLLLCCCLFLVAAWFLGDPIIEGLFGEVPPGLLQ